MRHLKIALPDTRSRLKRWSLLGKHFPAGPCKAPRILMIPVPMCCRTDHRDKQGMTTRPPHRCTVPDHIGYSSLHQNC